MAFPVGGVVRRLGRQGGNGASRANSHSPAALLHESLQPFLPLMLRAG